NRSGAAFQYPENVGPGSPNRYAAATFDFSPAANSFTDVNPTVGLLAVQDGTAAWGDYDNDGRLDLAMTGTAQNSLVASVYPAAAAGHVHDIQAGLPGNHVSAAAWGDYDNDGKLDLLMTGLVLGTQTPATWLYHNDGDGQFHDASGGFLTGLYSGSVAWGDYNGDGALDILATGLDPNGTPQAIVYQNEGNSIFQDI